MITREIITKILETSVNAPSGSNSQPWSFQVTDNEILVFAHPEKDHPILNYNHRGTWIAHGALVENIKIAASAFGYRPLIQIFPDGIKLNPTAKIKLEKGIPTEEGLFQVIPWRATNRKRYELRPLTTEQKKYLAQSVEEVGGQARIVWLEDREQINRLGRVAAADRKSVV